MKTTTNTLMLILRAACCTVVLSAWNGSAQVMHVNSVSVDSVWNSDSSWYDVNGILQQRYSRDCHISFLPQDTGSIAQCTVSVSLDSGKTWAPNPNPLQILVNCVDSSIHQGQKAYVTARILGQDRPNVVFKIETSICEPPSPITPNYNLAATVDGTTQFSSGATITISPSVFDTSKRLVDIKGTSTSGYSMELYFSCPSRATAPVTLGNSASGYAKGQYFEGSVGSNTIWSSADTITVIVNSFSIVPGDTTISVDFSYTAWGGPSGVAGTAKKISAGTVRKFGTFDYSDTLALRAILDANGITTISAASTSISVITLDQNNFHRIQSLNLHNKGISVIPAQIGALTAMEILRLDTNSISALPAEISQCTSLVLIRMSHNQLATLPSGIGSLHNLKTLILSHNAISSLPQSLWTITSLTQLDLDYNELDSLSSQVSNLVNLGTLLLNNNNLTTLPPSLKQSTMLQLIQIDNNHICPSTLSALDALFPGWLDLRAESDWRTTQGTCP